MNALVSVHMKWYFSVPEDRIEDYSCTGGSKWKLLVYRRMTVGIAGVPEDDSGNCWCTGG